MTDKTISERSETALAARLRDHVVALASKPRTPGSPEHDAAAAYIRRRMADAGFAVQEEVFQEQGFQCRNLFTRPIPEKTNGPLLIIGAHYDSVADSPGADDNASAVAALLEVARGLQPLLASKTSVSTRLQLAAYDLEEYGMLGSLFHVRQIQQAGQAVRGMIALEMLGYTDHRPGSQNLPPILRGRYPDVADFIGVVGNENSRRLLETVTAALKSIDGLPVESLAVPGDGRLVAETRLSDHSSFWDAGFPALMITDTSFFRNPHYHRASDTPDTLDYPFLAQVTLGVSEAVDHILG